MFVLERIFISQKKCKESKLVIKQGANLYQLQNDLKMPFLSRNFIIGYLRFHERR